jgi:hypothetical protein
VSKIEADRKSIPLFEVIEHIVGDLGQVALQYEDLGPKESGLLQTAGEEFSGARVPLPPGAWQVLLPVDEAIVSAWEGAWKKLRVAVRDGKLPVRGFRGGSEFSEEIKPEEFPELWHNRYSDFDLNVEYGGRCFLEFDECDKAEILNGKSLGASEVIWAGLCAVSGAEVLKLWPPSGETTSPARRVGRPQKHDWAAIENKAIELMDYHGDFSDDDSKWYAQVCLERALLEFCSKKFNSEPTESALRDPKHIPQWLFTWRTKRASI